MHISLSKFFEKLLGFSAQLQIVLSNDSTKFEGFSTHGYYNFTKFNQNRIKNKNVLWMARLTDESSVNPQQIC